MAAQVAVWSLQVLQTPRFKRSRVIYCQNWYCRTASVHWCRNERATAGVVGISQMRWAPGEDQAIEGPWRQRLGFDLSDGLAGRLDCRNADTKDGFAATRRNGAAPNAAETAQRCSPRMAGRRTVA